MPTICTDTSEWQVPLDNSYPHQWVIFRACDGTYRDKHFASNLAWAKAAAASGRITGYTVYIVWRPNVPVDSVLASMLGAPDRHVTVMIDVESWRGTNGEIRGEHSSEITALAVRLSLWLRSNQRVIAYGNRGDLDAIYPDRPAWLKLVVASYGSQRPAVANGIGWQYTDDHDWPLAPGLIRTTAPFGRCDHNVFPDHTPAQLAAALGVANGAPGTHNLPSTNTEHPVPTDPWEQIMSFYKDRADFEGAMRVIIHREVAKYFNGPDDQPRRLNGFLTAWFGPPKTPIEKFPVIK